MGSTRFVCQMEMKIQNKDISRHQSPDKQTQEEEAKMEMALTERFMEVISCLKQIGRAKAAWRDDKAAEIT